ncbi:hypothetical protein DPMN_065274 [Dreissena polymorpha]|uniref:Uncharacterized protein n=1 Tax=Dreissena polymorpha TaxID=45954 RepID=A0A9D4CEQ3_DREPO|nr:hypothetical protein DPMN_065274 [Dreissena polymorpha]
MSSEGTLSTPGDFPAFRLLTASYTYAFSMDVVRFCAEITLKKSGVWLKGKVVEVAAVFNSSVQECGALFVNVDTFHINQLLLGLLHLLPNLPHHVCFLIFWTHGRCTSL